MSDLYSLLRIQLQQHGLDNTEIDSAALMRVWPELLASISRTYLATDSYRQALERDLAAANYEKKLLSDKVLRVEEELLHRESQLNYCASHDFLTELLNRNEFTKYITRLLQNMDTTQTHAVLHIDVDRFKVVNDSCGQQAGDQLLRQLAHLLMNKLQPWEFYLARLGGDEFGVLLVGINEEDSVRVAEQICDAIQQCHFLWEKMDFSLAASIGVLCFNHEFSSPQAVLSKADSACYLAKDYGRNRVCLFQEKSIDVTRHNQEVHLLNEMNGALQENRFCLYAQTIVPLKHLDEGKVHCEILLRMLDRDNNLLLPNSFLPVAERYNLMPTLDKWVVSNTLDLLAQHQDKLNELAFCSINLSGQSVTDDRFHHFLFSYLSTTTVPCGKLCFEITETVAIANLAKATEFIHAVKRFGCQFALDDFGSGMSSFAYLKYLPVDFLKIDSVFVKGIVDDQIDYAMVKSINEIGHVMEKKTIAEFVENERIMQLLSELGIDYAQGYAIAKPQLFLNLLNHM